MKRRLFQRQRGECGHEQDGEKTLLPAQPLLSPESPQIFLFAPSSPPVRSRYIIQRVCAVFLCVFCFGSGLELLQHLSTAAPAELNSNLPKTSDFTVHRGLSTFVNELLWL